MNEQIRRLPVLPPDEIYRGNPNNPDHVLFFTQGAGWERLKSMKYWAGAPWPGILIQSAELALRGNAANALGFPAENWALPLPNLMRGGDPGPLLRSGGQDMVNWYWAIKQDWESKQRRTPELSGPPDTVAS